MRRKDIYPSKSEIIFRNGLTKWEEITSKRENNFIPIPLKTQTGNFFRYTHLPQFDEMIHEIETILNVLSKQTTLLSLDDAIINESYYSSKIEGAITTRRRTQDIIKNGIPPQDKSEQMVVNNYKALQFVLQLNRSDILAIDNLIQLQKFLTEYTLRQEDMSMRFRTDDVDVFDKQKQVVIHKGLDHTLIESYMMDMFSFASQNTFHPFITASILHFYIGYVHPFFDGNGRTARAMMYAYFIHRGYPMFRYFSISDRFYFNRKSYYDAYVLCEDENRDMTYFVWICLDILRLSVERFAVKLTKYVWNHKINNIIRTKNIVMTKNQKKVLRTAINNKGVFTLSNNKRKWWKSTEDAEIELEQLVRVGLFIRKNNYYVLFVNNDEFREKVANKIDSDFLRNVLLEQVEIAYPDAIVNLATHVSIEDIDNIDILSFEPYDEGVKIVGTGTMYVTIQYGSNHDVRNDMGMMVDQSFLFDFEMELDDDNEVLDCELMVDTSSFYD